MEPCVLIASACDSISPDTIVKGILDNDDLPEPLQIIDGIQSYPWHIDTKYYEADVHVCTMLQKSIGTQEFADSVNAVILCFDSSSESKLAPVEQWLSFTKEFEAEIKILICDQCQSEEDDVEEAKNSKGVTKLEAQKWCISNGFELVELNPDPEEDSDVEDDFPESLGMKRVVQALHAHLWPNLRMKDNNNSTKGKSMESKITPESMLENLDSMSAETFEKLFVDLNTMKSKASQLSPNQRKEFAEKVAMSFWRSLFPRDPDDDQN